MNKKSGFYKNGKSHANGGIPVLVDDNTLIEVEKFEYVICNNAMNSTKIFEFKDKTNKEILDEIFRYSDCEFEQHKANSGDFIICKLAVMDKKKRNITGTVKEIINVMQSEKSCNVTNDSKFKDGGEVNDETYTKWKNLVNMSKSELENFYNSKDGKEAGLSSSEASKQGISSGRESARWIMKMKDTPKSEWTPTMWRWANKQISFISRMSGMKGDLYDDKGNKTRKHTSLLIWGHNPKKYNNGGELKTNEMENKESKLNEIDNKKEILLKELEALNKLYKKLYSNVDIESPLSDDEKDLKQKMNKITSELNQLVLERRQLKKGIEVESEHKETAEKLYNREITPEQAAESIAKEHLSESPDYYKELDKMEEKLKEENTFEREGFQTGKGLLYEFFTPQEVSDKMLALAQHYGFKGGKVLEPAAGNGRLLKHLKDSEITAFEINPKNYEDLKKQFPNAKIYNFNFEKAFLKEPRYTSLIDSKATKTWLKDYPFDLVLANPPYGKFSGPYSSYFKFKGQVEHFFILQTLYLLKSGGIGVYLVPSSFLRNGINYNNIKKTIFEIASLTDAYRLPSNIFKDTQIGTDIIVLTKK